MTSSSRGHSSDVGAIGARARTRQSHQTASPNTATAEAKSTARGNMNGVHLKRRGSFRDQVSDEIMEHGAIRSVLFDEHSGMHMDEEREKVGKSIASGAMHDNAPMSQKDLRGIILLIVLYLLQGVPIGLAFGAIPFLLKSQALSYSEIGLFSLCTYPYSLKLLWSPIVDSCFFQAPSGGSPGTLQSRFGGRRKSWIIPIQTIVGVGFLWLGYNIDSLLAANNIPILTSIFFALILFAATQDIAVDGWALNLLSAPNLSYASTAQTVGINIGYFLSFTVFLALSSVDFSNKYLRSSATPLEYGVVTLSGYFKFWSVGYFLVTLYLIVYEQEDYTPAANGDLSVGRVYKNMIAITQLPNIRTFIIIHLIAKIGFQTNEAVTQLKLLESGFSKEDLAIASLVDFPFQIVFGYLAARWSRGTSPLRPWLWAFWGRLLAASAAALLVFCFPKAGSIGNGYFLLVILNLILSTFMGTVQFVGISAFHTQIADPLIGGTYMTLLNTVSNLGGTWPRFFVLQGVDAFTIAVCSATGQECVSDAGQAACTAHPGAICETQRDGYYIMSAICVLLGALSLVFFIQPKVAHLQRLPKSAWRVQKPS